jgi:hypothetical protein
LYFYKKKEIKDLKRRVTALEDEVFPSSAAKG